MEARGLHWTVHFKLVYGNVWNAPDAVRLATSVQGFPVSFSIDGKQYIAVTTGIGGGSPRQVPATIAPDIHHPLGGNALYVFALP